ncbi:MAG TPA: XdhC family protein [Chitinophagaceae bacterium]|nr:XdhC family protein [Chitinophagaceae bacterium]
MKKQLGIWKFVRKSFEESIPVMILFVLESKGSSPGRQGFFMAVNANNMEGSIGGGIMEHKFVEMAKEQLQAASYKLQVKQQIHDKAAAKNQSGMICSGEQTILIYRIQKKDINHIEKIIATLEQKKNGTLHLSTDGILFEDKLPAKDFVFSLKNEDDWTYTENIGYKNHLYVVGGGHCALAFSKLMSEMDFYIHLFEDREGLNTMEANNYVHEKTVVKDYSDLAQQIPSGENNYVVVMTFGYRTDDIAIRALMQKQFKYFGLLGSKKKIEKMFAEYRKEGIEEEVLTKIYSPIGISIKSQSPEEIAISIAAEIIEVKNEI